MLLENKCNVIREGIQCYTNRNGMLHKKKKNEMFPENERNVTRKGMTCYKKRKYYMKRKDMLHENITWKEIKY